ncbi:MAG: T9SS type A sorting domain-containing protein [bacterium]|nr:T9SS type A sorting domain-containing protein [bacterium]
MKIKLLFFFLLGTILFTPAYATIPLNYPGYYTSRKINKTLDTLLISKRYSYPGEFARTADFLTKWQVQNPADTNFGGMIEAEAGELANVIQTDNTLEAIWVWARYGQLTGDTAKFSANIRNAKIYCDKYPPWKEEGAVGYDYYRVHNSAWGLTAAEVYCETYGDSSYYGFADSCADYIMSHPLNIYHPSYKYINSFVTGWAAGNLYQYGILRNNNNWTDSATTYGERLMYWITLSTQIRLSEETWAMSSGTIVWGICNSTFREDTILGKAWIETNGSYVDTFQVWRDCGDGYNWDNAWNVAYCNAHYAMYEISKNTKYKDKHKFLTDALLSYDTDFDGGITSTTQDPDTEDMCWVSSYLAKMGLNNIFETLPDTDAGIIKFISPQNQAKYNIGDTLDIILEVSNFGLKSLSGVNVKITGCYEDSAFTDLNFTETKNTAFSKRCLPQIPDTLTLIAVTTYTGDNNLSNDTTTVTFFIDLPAVSEMANEYKTSMKITPNPVISYATLSYQLPVKAKTSLKIYDVGGRLVKTLINEEKKAGSYNVNLDARSLPPGIYFAKIICGNRSFTQKLTLLK